jgi:hypothetical protein
MIGIPHHPSGVCWRAQLARRHAVTSTGRELATVGHGIARVRATRDPLRLWSVELRGAELKTPGWVDMVVGPEPFPVDEMAPPQSSI